MRSWSLGFTLVTLFIIGVMPTAASNFLKMRKAELAELVSIWKEACQCLDTMLKLTGPDAQAKGEGIPDDVAKELKNLLKIIAVFNLRMRDALNAFFHNSTESIENSTDLQKWRMYLDISVNKVSGQIDLLGKNIGMKSISATSAELVEKRMEQVKNKCLGLTLCLPRSKLGFEQRFFELIGRMIKSDFSDDT